MPLDGRNGDKMTVAGISY